MKDLTDAYPRSWKKIEDELPPTLIPLLVVKHYIGQEFSQETGGYEGRYFPATPFICISMVSRSLWDGSYSWESGGCVTHWMELPDLPK